MSKVLERLEKVHDNLVEAKKHLVEIGEGGETMSAPVQYQAKLLAEFVDFLIKRNKKMWYDVM